MNNADWQFYVDWNNDGVCNDGTNDWSHSEELDDAVWTKTNCHIHTNVGVAPDGKTTADKLVEDLDVAQTHYLHRDGPEVDDNSTFTVSFYVKPDIDSGAYRYHLSWYVLNYSDSVACGGRANLISGLITTYAGTVSIEAIGEGWYRITGTGVAGSGPHANKPYINIIMCNGDNDGAAYDGDGVLGFFVWGLQWESATATASRYDRTVHNASIPYENISDYVYSANWSRGRDFASQVTGQSSAGVCNIALNNRSARFSSFNAASPLHDSILPKRRVEIRSLHGVNRFKDSNNFKLTDYWSWSATNVTIADVTTGTYSISPSMRVGTQSITDDAVNDLHVIGRPITANQNELVTFSVYAACLNGKYLCLVGQDRDVNMNYAVFDLDAGVVTHSSGVTSGIQGPFGGGGGTVAWYRCWISFNTSDGAPAAYVQIRPNHSDDYETTYLGDGSHSLLLWGAQLETGSTLTDYDPTTTTPHPMTILQWTGYLDSITPVPSVALDHQAHLRALGPISLLAARVVDIAMHTAIGSGDAVTHVLDAIDWSATDRQVDTGALTIGRWWPGSKRDALNLLREIEDAEAGFLREGKDGSLIFDDRNHRTALTTLAAYGLSTYDPDLSNRAFQLDQLDALRNIYNRIRVRVYLTSLTNTVTLWTLTGDAPAVPAKVGAVKGSITLWAQFPNAASTIGQVAVSLWDTITKTANSEAGGGGDDETPNVTITPTKFDTSCKLLIENDATHIVYITSLIIDGVAVVENDAVTVEAEDPTSIAAYGERIYEYDGKLITSIADAQTLANLLLAYFKDPRPRVRQSIHANTSAWTLGEALTRDISDKAEFYASAADTTLGISGNFFIERIEHTLDRDRNHIFTVELSEV